MFIDLNVPFAPSGFNSSTQPNPKQKQKQKQNGAASSTPIANTPTLSSTDLDSINSRLDVISHLGYTIVALNYTVYGKIDPATHVNPLLAVPPRKDLVILRRLTIVLDDSSEKGFGLSTQHATHLASYDIIALQPTTPNTFSLACLGHTQPSPTTAHIISIDAASATPQLPFRMKLSMVRTAIRNGGVFEISYAGALASDESARRNWWSGAREVARATKGKGLLLSGGAQVTSNLRAPMDAINLASVLGLDQNMARNAMSADAKSLITRANTRQTYRAVLSAPVLIDAPVETNTSSPIDSTPTPSALGSSVKRVREAEDIVAQTSDAGTSEQSESAQARPPKRSKSRGVGV
ncbi:Ribonuclease P protein subunit p30 OS=Bos taurus GN=RPP30 PE=2 SV=1 [Rhizoctonia solani AG-1 IB]|uniref:Ribonuclease P protein subunit p30 n=1 Tax=Thanatephorus cucumeris (strain AG1-IB / isolate 7/3/14) TaxID=1108050 RepID=A0A0B7FF07_THACB|nr:Ribonuclease P protein subunit p30 OS=Bos taurus GN=RPP30 PE=2 SV=1 [Rhizoctonia solani AG-1 IB]